MTKELEYYKGVRASIAWLHEHAREMNDPHARAILNAAAFALGVNKPDPKMCPDNGDAKEILAQLELHASRIPHASLTVGGRDLDKALMLRAATLLARQSAVLEALRLVLLNCVDAILAPPTGPGTP